MTFLLFDTISCPYLENTTKEEILKIYGVGDATVRRGIIDYKVQQSSKQQWFTTWYNFDFGKELDRKKGFEVY